MLIKHKIQRLEPTSKKYLFIELHVEDFRCKNRISLRVQKIAKLLNGSKKGNIIRIPRINLTTDTLNQLIYLDKVSTKYKQCLLRSKFNYAIRNYDNFTGYRRFVKL